MNICIVARNEQELPPYGYGGSERVIYSLIKHLLTINDVENLYVFSKTSERLRKLSKTISKLNIVTYPEALNDDGIKDFVKNKIKSLKLEIDIIHDHSEMIIANKDEFDCPVIFTLHYMSKDYYPYENTIYPSNYCKEEMNGKINLDNVIYHCLPDAEYIPGKINKDNELLYLGVVKESKGVDIAINIAERLGRQLIIAGPQDPDDPNLIYFNTKIKPRLNDNIRYVGEVKSLRQRYFLTSSKLMLFPTKTETFGLAAIEAMASGTPVLMFDNCTGREILPKHDKFEFLAINEDDMVEKTRIILDEFTSQNGINLARSIQHTFDGQSMAEKYYNAYKSIIETGHLPVKTELYNKGKVSLCMIVKNEENRLSNCLNSVKDFVDEMIIVDTGSTDNTKEIAKQFGAKIYDFEWCYDFSKARNEALKHATKDYILWLDADDTFDQADIDKLMDLKQKLSTNNLDLVWMYYDYRHDNNGNVTYTFQNERLFRNHRGITWNCVVHEVLDLKGKVKNELRTDIHVRHTSNHDNTNKYVEFFKKNEELGHQFNSREKYFYCMEVYKHEDKLKAYQLANDIINQNDGTTNTYEMHSTYSMKGMMEMNWGMYNEAIISLTNSIAYHQPLPYLLFNIGECHRFLGHYKNAEFYYQTLIHELPFEERFSNNSVYTNHERDLHEFKCKAYISMVFMCYYNYLDKELAKNYNEELLKYDPTNESGLYNKGVL